VSVRARPDAEGAAARWSLMPYGLIASFIKPGHRGEIMSLVASLERSIAPQGPAIRS
jgi:hypothetical protein